jgi:DNA modification methylase
MRAMAPESVDAVVCDPPYGLEFMSQKWDKLDWQAGGGMSKPGIGERAIEWPAFSATSRFGAANPTCGTCGGRLRGKKKCACAEPSWQPIGKRRNEENEGLPDDVTGSGMRVHLNAMQEWHLRWAAEAHRVLKPGGYLLAFGGTRTYHRMACAVEDAGFELRDSITWHYGNGMPKVGFVGKQIDKALGREREIVGYDESRARPNRKYASGAIGNVGGNENTSNRTDNGATLTAPASEEAARWDGWSPTLKPASEPIVVARKPMQGTLVDNVLKHGTGAFNIKACSVVFQPGGDQASAKPQGRPTSKAKHIGAEPDAGAGESRVEFSPRDNSAGRWPSNVLLSHIAPQWAFRRPEFFACQGCNTVQQVPAAEMHTLQVVGEPLPVLHVECPSCSAAQVLACEPVQTGCVPVGTRMVKGDGHHPGARPPGSKVAGAAGHKGQADLEERHAGEEEVPAYRCAPGCPVAALDAQSGAAGAAAPASSPKGVGRHDHGIYQPAALGFRVDGEGSAFYGDKGGASRFFPVLNYEEADFMYCAKTARSEREAGLEHIEKADAEHTVLRKVDSAGSKNPRAGAGNTAGGAIERCSACGKAAGASARRGIHAKPCTVNADGACTPEVIGRREGRTNVHPTVKPIKLMRWLVKLVTPPGGIVLDPFGGSGTTGIAAHLEGFEAILCEREAQYIEIAVARIRHHGADVQVVETAGVERAPEEHGPAAQASETREREAPAPVPAAPVAPVAPAPMPVTPDPAPPSTPGISPRAAAFLARMRSTP